MVNSEQRLKLEESRLLKGIVDHVELVGIKHTALPLYRPRPQPKQVSQRSYVLAVSLVGIALFLLFRNSYYSLNGYGQFPDSGVILRSPHNVLPGWPAPRNPAYLIRAKRGAVATENKICSDLGVEILKKGGNAVDASITAVLCTGVVNMFRYS